MYLKKIKMKGFKSFAENVEFEFSKGISAIVGPNGSGKSNIVDAIRWVLGEQSTKMLRGKKMEDVIFAGTENKAPLSYAEVAITMENEDDDDLTVVSRKLFRTGESEYCLNNKSCKLKDIHALFSDTGLGKNGYSLINQGEIESIANSNPMELRRIVEEAVGIVGYKTRKQEAEKKLAAAQNNMDRLQDILDELEKRLKPLKRQSEKAREYIGIYDELKALDLYFFKQQMDEASEKKAQYENALSEIERAIFDCHTQMQSIDLRYQEKKAAIHQQEEEKQVLSEKIAQNAMATTKANKDVLVCEERCRHLEESAQRLLEEKEKISQKTSALEAQITAINTEMTDLLQDLTATEDELTCKNAEKTRYQDHIDQIEAMKAKAAADEQHKAEMRNQIVEEIQALQKEIGALETRQSIEQMAENQIKNDQIELENNVIAVENQLVSLQSELTEYQKKLLESEQQGKQYADRSETLIQKLNLLNNNLSVNQSKINYLKKVEESYSDYLPGIQLVMNQSGLDVSNVFGPVGQLFQVDPKYATAIDVALGRKTQNIVVKDLKTAHQCINLLKNKKAGRATFLPIDNLKQPMISSKDRYTLQHLKGVIGIAAELIKCEDRFQCVAENLLNRTIVVDQFGSAEQVQKSLNSFTIVTLEGEIFYPGGAVVGGTNKNGQHSPLFKRIEIQQLQEENQSFKDEIITCTSQIERIKSSVQQWQNSNNEIQKAMTELNGRIWQAKTKKEQLIQQQHHLTEDQKTSASIKENIADDLKHATALLQEKQTLLLSFEKGSEVLADSDRRIYAERLSAVEKEIADLQVQYAQIETKLASKEQQNAALQNNLTDVKNALEQKQNEIADNQKILDETNAFIAERRSDSIKTEDQTVSLKERLGRIEQDLKVFSAEVEKFDYKIRELNHELIAKTENQNNFEIEKQKILSKCQYLEESVFSRYGLNTIMAFDALKICDLSRFELTEKRQQELRSHLMSLGQVNMESIEEYAEVKERYDFLSDQMADMTKAKNELNGIIGDLFRSMEKQFTEGFEQLQNIFSDVFSVLFEGGHAQIRYADPDNKMESGIELSAQPPGKNLKHISLLSGGEKSMTAISLLFAFLKLNPTPFCVIDEIDAALDDQNIARFTRFMDSIAKENQFILITHRKKTLEVCDTIYGVTMSVSGISKMISMRLADYTE